MASTINASTGPVPGLISTGDNSGQIELQANGVTKLTVNGSGVSIPTLVGANINLASNVTGTLPIANGGTGTTSTTFANLATNVTGTLPIANGGTGTTSTTFANLTTNVTGTLPVGNGGTGATTLTANNVLLGNGTSALQVVAPGSSGNVLTSNGTTWQSTAPAGGGSWIYLTGITGSNVAQIDLEYSFDTTYDTYVLIGNGFYGTWPGGTDNLAFRFKVGGSYLTGSYRTDYHNSSLSSNFTGSSSQPYMNFGTFLPRDTDTGNQSNFILYLWNAGKSQFQCCTGHGSCKSQIVFIGGTQEGTSGALQGVRFYGPNSNFLYGTVRLYGIKKS